MYNKNFRSVTFPSGLLYADVDYMVEFIVKWWKDNKRIKLAPRLPVYLVSLSLARSGFHRLYNLVDMPASCQMNFTYW